MNTDNMPAVFRKLLAFRRRFRVAFMLSKVVVTPKMKVIDIGCGVDGRSFDDHVPDDWEITGIDILPGKRIHHNHPGFSYVQQDAQDLTYFKDKEFDLAVSIGMLEHVTEKVPFNRIVSEIRRVAKQYIVVVPFRYCWIEPHYGVPFFPILPYSIKLSLVKTFNLSNHRVEVIRDRDFVNKHYRWLSNSQYKEAFPDSTIHLLPTLDTIAIVGKSSNSDARAHQETLRILKTSMEKTDSRM